MKIRVVPEARSLDEDSVRGHVVVVIDTLRATSVIAYAVAGGASVQPVKSIAAARRLRSAKVSIVGERGGKPLPGFDHGNSPVELSRIALTGRRLVLTTTNGTGAVARSAQARAIFAGALVNATAIGRAVTALAPVQLDLVCAGRTTGVALEDLAGAGAIVHALLPAGADVRALTDGARLSVELFRKERARLGAFLRGCESGRNLVRLGAADDVAMCARLDALTVAPRLRSGRFS